MIWTHTRVRIELYKALGFEWLPSPIPFTRFRIRKYLLPRAYMQPLNSSWNRHNWRCIHHITRWECRTFCLFRPSVEFTLIVSSWKRNVPYMYDTWDGTTWFKENTPLTCCMLSEEVKTADDLHHAINHIYIAALHTSDFEGPLKQIPCWAMHWRHTIALYPPPAYRKQYMYRTHI